jgi:hypothetical protein
MKKLLIMAAFIAFYCISAQGSVVHLQNYTPYILEHNIIKSNQTNTAGGCSPNWEGSSSITGLLVLSNSPSASTPVESYYEGDLNLSNTFNPLYPQTPKIDRWILNNDYSNPYILPGSTIPLSSSNAATYLGFKFGIKDPTTGTNIAGYFPIGYIGCGQPPVLDLSAYTTLIQASYFTFSGEEWVVFF